MMEDIVAHDKMGVNRKESTPPNFGAARYYLVGDKLVGRLQDDGWIDGIDGTLWRAVNCEGLRRIASLTGHTTRPWKEWREVLSMPADKMNAERNVEAGEMDKLHASKPPRKQA